MVTINTTEETKTRFRDLKLKVSVEKKRSISEEDLMIILLDKYEGVKRR